MTNNEDFTWAASQFLGVRVGTQKAQDVRNCRDREYSRGAR